MQRVKHKIDPQHLVTIFGVIEAEEVIHFDDELDTEPKELSVLKNLLNRPVDMYLTKELLPAASEILDPYFINCITKQTAPYLDEDQSLLETIDFAIRLSLLSMDSIEILITKRPHLNKKYLEHLTFLCEKTQNIFRCNNLGAQVFFLNKLFNLEKKKFISDDIKNVLNKTKQLAADICDNNIPHSPIESIVNYIKIMKSIKLPECDNRLRICINQIKNAAENTANYELHNETMKTIVLLWTSIQRELSYQDVAWLADKIDKLNKKYKSMITPSYAVAAGFGLLSVALYASIYYGKVVGSSILDVLDKINKVEDVTILKEKTEKVISTLNQAAIMLAVSDLLFFGIKVIGHVFFKPAKPKEPVQLPDWCQERQLQRKNQ